MISLWFCLRIAGSNSKLNKNTPTGKKKKKNVVKKLHPLAVKPTR
jgi:hypothetical protein